MTSVVEGQMNATDSANPVKPKPQPPTRKMNWFERHHGWTLLLIIICTPFILWGIVVALMMLALLFPPSIGEAIARGAISAAPLGYIAIVILMVRWYKTKRRQSKAAADYGNHTKMEGNSRLT